MSSFRRTTANRSASFLTESRVPTNREKIVHQVSGSVFQKETVHFCGFLFLQTDPSLEMRIMDDSVKCWSNLRIEYSKIWHSNSSYRTRRFEIIYWFNHLHFFDPQHNFRRKMWSSTYLSPESYHPTSKCCWCREFVKTKIWNLQSLLICSINLWSISLTRDDWIFGWRSGLASLILNWCLFLTLFHCGWMNWFRYMRTPCVQFLRMECWRGRGWIFKNVSRYTILCSTCLAAHLCGSAFLQNGFSFRQELDEVRMTQVNWQRGNVHCAFIHHLENHLNHSCNWFH